MSTEAVHPDFRVGVGSLLAFVAVVLGLVLGYPVVGGLAFLCGVGLLISGATGTPFSAWLSAVR